MPPTLLADPLQQNALFNSALRQSTQIRKDLDQFADSAAPSPQLQAQLNASLATFSRTIDDYGKLAKQEPVQTKQEKAFERLKNFRAELDEYRESFKRIKSANEDIVRFSSNSRVTTSKSWLTQAAENYRSAHRVTWSSPTSRCDTREPLRAIEHQCQRERSLSFRTLTTIQP